MADNIIELGYNVADLSAETKTVVELLRSVLEQANALSNVKVSIGVDGFAAYTEAVRKQQEATAALTNTYPALAAAQTAAANANKAATAVVEAETKTLEENIAARLKMQNTMSSLQKDAKDNQQLLKDNIITQAEYNKRLVEATASIERYKNRISEMNGVIKAQTATATQAAAASEAASKKMEAATRADAKAAANATNDYKQLSLAYNDAALKAKNYQIQLGANHPLAVQATADANVMGNQLRALDYSVGQYQRNVGNYSGALTGYANTLRGLRGPTKLLGEALGIGAMQADQARLVIEHSLQGLAALSRSKEANAEKALIAAAAAKTEAIAISEATVARNAEIESLEFEMVSLNANSVAEIGNANSTQLAIIQERLNVLALEAQAAATAEAAAATGGLSLGMKLLAGTGVFLLLAGIGYLVYKFIEFRNAAKEAAEMMELYNTVMAEANKTAGSQINNLKILYAAANDVTASTKDRMDAVLELKKEFPDYFEKLNAEMIMNGKAGDTYKLLTKDIEAASRAKAVKDRKDIIEAQKLAVKEQKDKINNATNDEYNAVKGSKTIYVAGGGSATGGGGGGGDLEETEHEQKVDILIRRQAAMSEQDEKMKALDNQDAMLDRISGIQAQAKVIEDAHKHTGGAGKADAKDETFKYQQEAAKNAYEAKHKIQLAELEDLKAMSKNVSLSYQLRVDAAKVASMKEQEIIAETVAYEMLENKKKEDNDVKEILAKKQSAKVRNSELAAIHEAAAEKIKDINATAQLESDKQAKNSIIDVHKLEEDAIKDRKKLYDEGQKDAKNGIKNEREMGMSDIESNAISKELKGVELLNKKFKESKIGVKEYNLELSKIKDAIEVEKLTAQIDVLNKEWTKLALNPMIEGGADKDAELAKLRDQISKLQLQLANEEHKGDNNGDKQKFQEKYKDEISEVGSGVDAIQSIADARFEREKNQIEQKKNLLEAAHKSEIDGINASSLSAQEKAAQITIAEATAASKRRELEKQQRDADIKKATFDKAVAILKITAGIVMDIVDANWASAAAGTAGLVSLIATPIPKYADGTEDHKGGLAIFGEAGAEMITEPNKAPYIVDKETLSYLPKHTKVKPISDTELGRMTDNAMSSQFVMLAQINGLMENKQQIRDDKLAERIVNGLAPYMMEANQIAKRKPSPIVMQPTDKTAWNAYVDSQTK